MGGLIFAIFNFLIFVSITSRSPSNDNKIDRILHQLEKLVLLMPLTCGVTAGVETTLQTFGARSGIPWTLIPPKGFPSIRMAVLMELVIDPGTVAGRTYSTAILKTPMSEPEVSGGAWLPIKQFPPGHACKQYGIPKGANFFFKARRHQFLRRRFLRRFVAVSTAVSLGFQPRRNRDSSFQKVLRGCGE